MDNIDIRKIKSMLGSNFYQPYCRTLILVKNSALNIIWWQSLFCLKCKEKAKFPCEILITCNIFFLLFKWMVFLQYVFFKFKWMVLLQYVFFNSNEWYSCNMFFLNSNEWYSSNMFFLLFKWMVLLQYVFFYYSNEWYSCNMFF